VSFLDRIAAIATYHGEDYRPFRVGGLQVGQVKADLARILQDFPDVFNVHDDAVNLSETLTGFEQRTQAVDAVLHRLAERGILRRWRDEPYPVAPSFTAPPLFNIERAAVPPFGLRAAGVHLVGYVREGGNWSMWVARRALDKPSAPGKLDQMVAGGQPAGLSVRNNLTKECAEEANIPADLAAKARPVSIITYCTERPEGLRHDVVYNYDLELPRDFIPENTDGEVESFELWSLERVMETVRDTDDFKFNCSVVIIDFLIRHGFIEADHPDYIDIIEGMHRG
jgi:hypothetical protein